jgi:hypothetical protein
MSVYTPDDDLDLDLEIPESKYDLSQTEIRTITRAIHYNHSSPLLCSRSDYFLPDYIDTNKYEGVLTAVITCFNEAAGELEVTLNDLYIQHKVMIDAGLRLDLHVCIVLDGWSHTSNSMKKYIKELFPVNHSERLNVDKDNQFIIDDWHHYVNSWQFSNEETVDTLILQRREYQVSKTKNDTDNESQNKKPPIIRVESRTERAEASANLSLKRRKNLNNSSVQYIPIIHQLQTHDPLFDKIPTVKITTIIKRDNRRKHNSHEWFLLGFAPIYTIPYRSIYNGTDMQFIFMTDCGTRFDRSCLLMLTEECLRNSNVVASTGIGRVMGYKQQLAGERNIELEASLSSVREGILADMYRSAQGFDYEAYVTSLNPAYDLGGLLPVIPGPCGFFRYDLLADNSKETYFLRINEEMIRLARHSILSNRQSQTDIMNQINDNVASYVRSQLKIIDQVRKWEYIEARYATDANSPKNLTPSQSKEQSEVKLTGLNIKSLKPTGGAINRRRSVSTSVDFTFDKSSLTGIKDAINTTVEELYSKISEAHMLISSSQAVFEERSLFLCSYMIYVVEYETYLQKISREFVQIFKKFILKISSEFDRIAKQAEQFEVILTKLKNVSHMENPEELITALNSLYDHCLEFNKIQIEQLDHVSRFSSAILDVICDGDTELYQQIIKQIEYRISAPQEISDTIVEEQVIQELRNSRDPLEFYFRCVNKNPEQAGILLGSLLLTEDRILSYVCVLRSNASMRVKTSFVQSAIFYCQAETATASLLAQRRRWTNGSLASCVWLLYMGWIGMFKNQSTGRSNGSFLMYLLFVVQFFQYCIVSLVPAIYGMSLKYIGQYLFGSDYNGWLSWLHLAFYTLFVYLHTKQSSTKIHLWLYTIMAFINSWLLVLLIYVIYTFVQTSNMNYCLDSSAIYNYHYSTYNVTSINSTYLTDISKSYNYWQIFSCFTINYIVILIMGLPYLLAFLTDILFFFPTLLFYAKKRPDRILCKSTHSDREVCRHCKPGKSYHIHTVSLPTPTMLWHNSAFIRMLRFSIRYYLLLPTLTMMIPVYSFCRTWELTWGNRPSCMTVWNKTVKEMEQIKDHIYSQAYLLSAFVWASNMTFYFLAIQLPLTTNLIIFVTYFIFGWSLLQMLISFAIIIYRLFFATISTLFRWCRVCYYRGEVIDDSDIKVKNYVYTPSTVTELSSIESISLDYNSNNDGFDFQMYKRNTNIADPKFKILEDKFKDILNGKNSKKTQN